MSFQTCITFFLPPNTKKTRLRIFKHISQIEMVASTTFSPQGHLSNHVNKWYYKSGFRSNWENFLWQDRSGFEGFQWGRVLLPHWPLSWPQRQLTMSWQFEDSASLFYHLSYIPPFRKEWWLSLCLAFIWGLGFLSVICKSQKAVH